MEGWTGRIDAEDGDAGRRWHQVVQPLRDRAEPGVALLGFASHAGVLRNQGRAGAADGPRALRRALSNLAYHPIADTPLYDGGDVHCEGDALEAAQAALGVRVARLIDDGHLPIVLGGGHEVAWGSFQGLARVLEPAGRLARFGIVNFDAHFDLRHPAVGARGTSGTPFFQIHEWLTARGLAFRYLCLGVSRAANTPALFEAARERGVAFVPDEALTWPRFESACATIDRFLAGVDVLQVSVCLDVFPGAVAPGVSAPAARGIDVALGLALLDRALAVAGHGTPASRVALVEVAEFAPPLDRDGLTARLAARIVHDLCARVL
jgi:formiminoglutamase